MHPVPPVGSFNGAAHVTQGLSWEILTHAASIDFEATAPNPPRLLPRGLFLLTFSSAGLAGYTGATASERMVAAECRTGSSGTAPAWAACTKGPQQRQVSQAVRTEEAKSQESGRELAEGRTVHRQLS